MTDEDYDKIIEELEAKLEQGILIEYDDGSRVSLSGFAGGASEGGAWSNLTLMKEEQDGAVRFRHYTADGGWIEELETKLQAVTEDKVDVVVELTKLKTHLEDFFALLEITEQKEDGRYFHPTTIRCYRALDAEKLETILAELKRSITANDKSDE